MRGRKREGRKDADRKREARIAFSSTRGEREREERRGVVQRVVVIREL